MTSDKTLSFVITVCVIIVAIATVIKIKGSSDNIHHPLTVISRYSNDVVDYDSSFYEEPSTNNDKSKLTIQSTKNPVIHSVSPRHGIQGLSARSFVIGNAKTGEVYEEYDANRVLPVASMSKLVTAFVATDLLSDSAPVEVSSSSVLAPPDKSNLHVGERYKLSEILYPLLLNSSNVAAEAISSSTGDRVEFLENMSSYAWEIGMSDTFFADPSGVSPRNAATARDLFALAEYLVNYRPDILELTRIAENFISTTTDHGAHLFESTHPFVNDLRFIGGKTGRTPEAGETMLTIMDIQNIPVAVIVLGSKDRENDTNILLKRIQKSLTITN